MTEEMMSLQALLEKSADTDLLREMIGFAAHRLMELEVENLTGLDCPAPKPSPLDGDSPMYRPRQLVDLAAQITDTALMVHGFEALQ
jgi:hypothetical protein